MRSVEAVQAAAAVMHAEQLSRRLWEKVFTEDSSRFLDYYDEEIAAGNRIYLDLEQEEAVSMLHLNPNRLRVGDATVDVCYIVAVATVEEYRHQGRMRRLLYQALSDLRKEGSPFVYLMPASEKIYQPFDFRTVAVQNWFSVEKQAPENTQKLRCVPLDTKDDQNLSKLAAFAEKVLSGCCMVSTRRDLSYYRRICKEQRAMNGGIIQFFCGEVLCGCCFSGEEDGIELWELLLADGCRNEEAVTALQAYFQQPFLLRGTMPGRSTEGISRSETGARPMTMVRMASLEAFAGCLRSICGRVEFMIRIRDEILPENTGIWSFCIDQTSGSAKKRTADEIPPQESLETVDIGDLTECFFGRRHILGVPDEQLKLLTPVYLNELV
ncbi:MAG: GNAT family N-acetyltransferase [Eubacteriales bacterium]|nr:GNAT family N-acetyltransferase [Eubacteriales bacterium]